MVETTESSNTPSDVPGVFYIDKKGACPCVICLDHMQEDTDVAILKCGHRFHASCLLESAVSGNDSCALCRMTVGKKPESRPDLTAPLANIFIQNEFNQIALGRVMNSFCENLTPEAKEKWMLMGTDEKLNACGELIDTFRIFGMRLCRQIYTWINEGDSRMHIPEEAVMDPLAFPSWSFGVYSAEESVHENDNERDSRLDLDSDDDAVNNDDESGEYADMPALVDDEIVPVRLSFDEGDDVYVPELYLPEQFKAMVNIQRMMRGCLERRKYKFLLYKKWISEHRLFEHGIMLFKIRKIQAAWRGYIDNKMRKHQQGSFKAATEIQRMWRGYQCRTSRNINDNNVTRNTSISITLQSINRAMTNINIIPPNSTDNLTTIEAIENNINNAYHAWDNYLEINSFLNNSGLSDSITRRIMNNDFLSNYENLMNCSIDDLMWPAGGSGTHSMFTQNEANDIFGEIMRSRAHDGWGVFETVD